MLTYVAADILMKQQKRYLLEPVLDFFQVETVVNSGVALRSFMTGETVLPIRILEAQRN